MKKIFLLIVAFGCMAAQAQTEKIDAISATQGESTDWYRFADYDDVVEVSITAQGIQFPGDPGKTYAIANGAVYTAFGTAPEEKITLTAADFSVTKEGTWVYDGTKKEVKVEFINVEHAEPSKDIMTILYSKDELINAGTYQVSIDIKENDDYNAVTITSDDWKFTIEKADLTADNFTYKAPEDLDWDGNAKTAAVTFNSQDKLTGCGEITVKYQKDAVETSPVDAGDYTVSIDVAEGDNYNVAEGLTSEDWKFTIVAPAPELTYTRTGANDWGTFCFPYAPISVSGATFYSLATYNQAESYVEFEVVANPVAGVPYVFNFSDDNHTMTWTYKEENRVELDENGANGLYGTYDGYEVTNQEGIYMVSNNAIRNAMQGSWLGEYRAYIKLNDIVNKQPNLAPRVRMAVPGNGAPTRLNGIKDNKKAQKIMRDGQFYILRDNKIYTIEGLKIEE